MVARLCATGRGRAAFVGACCHFEEDRLASGQSVVGCRRPLCQSAVEAPVGLPCGWAAGDWVASQRSMLHGRRAALAVCGGVWRCVGVWRCLAVCGGVLRWGVVVWWCIQYEGI